MLKSLKVGDRVVTTGGIIGTITEGGEHFIKLEIADKIRVDVGRGYIAGKIAVKDGKEAEVPGADGQSASTGGASQSGGFLAKLFKK
jgi:hypothetical protein